MRVSTPPPASSAGSDDANRMRCESSLMYSGLMPSRSRPSSTRPLSRSVMANANIPYSRSTNLSPQWWYALSSTSVSLCEKNR